VYIWVSNESKEARVWFDDLTITHTEHIVVQATDYGAWGDVIREQKSDLASYRYGYQGQFAEKDEETGWSHFELREYDAVVGRWTGVDPKCIGWSPYIGMNNDPVSMADPDGGAPIHDKYYLNGRLHKVVKNDQPDRYFDLLKNEEYSTGYEAVEIFQDPQFNPSVLMFNNMTGYVYNRKDLAIRAILLENDGVMAAAIRGIEKKGDFQPIHNDNWYDWYVANYDSDDAFHFAMDYYGSMVIENAGAPGIQSRRVTLLPKRFLPNVKGLNSSLKVDSSIKNPWNRFTSAVKGQPRYQGPNRMANLRHDYYPLADGKILIYEGKNHIVQIYTSQYTY
jgi:RHS repeat-associated protein